MVMVMETPSPKNVGREFVRQYYTMLNNSPLHLHRFYNSNSSFVHGGIDQPGKETKPVYGQQEIHKKIMQLNFRDCHTKIRQVDSHATLGNGVVVQVTGELSNDGQPMRRFMQTFVLVPQSPKRYYVHNDIFRYQDEVFPNEEESDSPEGAPESETEEERVEVPGMPDIIQEHSASAYLDQQTVSNGAAHVEELAAAAPVTAQPSVPLTSQAPHPPVTAQPPTIPEPVIPEIEKLEQVAPPEIPATYEEKPKTPEPPEDIALQHTPQQSSPSENNASPEPKTYANMVSKNATSTPITSSTSNTPTAWHATGPAKSTTPSQATNHHPHQNNQRSESKPDGYQNSQGAQPQRVPRSRGNPVRGGLRDRGPGRGPEETGDGDRRRLQHPDSHQLFVGNLPHNVSEDELRETFSKYGNVVDLRINNKPTAKPGNMGRYPNFGFIVFEDPGAVHRCLSEKLFINHHRLNVEEKKTKPREQRMSGSGDGRIGPGRGMGRGGMGAGRGGGRGGMGGINRSDSRGGGNPGGRGGFGQNPRR